MKPDVNRAPDANRAPDVNRVPNASRAPVRVLTVGMTATAGGVENFLMACCGSIDRERVQFDFLTRYEDAAYPEKRRALGKTWVIPRRSEDPVKYYREIRAFFEQHAKEYDVIWDNECMFNDLTPLKLAAEYGIPVRIAHSHNPQNSDPSLAGKARGTLHRAQRRTLARYANVLWACTEESAKWACPAMDLPFTIIPHAIDAQAYRFDAKVRAEVRAHYGLTDCLVVGQVGRLAYQKNQTFLLEAFARLHQREPRARLVLVGDGPNLLTLEAKAVELGVEDEVLFLGHRDDVARLLMAFDLFAMPSHFEGLGMAAVEAQAAGLPCLLSSAFPKAAAITEDVTFLEPEDPDLWAERMLDILENASNCVRPDNLDSIVRTGFDIRDAAEKLTARFEQLVAEKPSFKRRFLLTTSPADPADALADKARSDVQRIAAEAGYALINPPVEKQCDKWWQQALQMGRIALGWGKLFFKLHHGDLLLVQYPWHPVKAAPVARWALHFLQWKGAKTAAFVHDLDSLRRPDDPSARWSDQELLPRFDRIIAQNARMAGYLTGQGVREDAVIQLGLPDVLTQEPAAGAGEKEFTTLLPDESDRSGAAAAYAMLSSPLEASRSLAQGVPLIVWKWSALAAFVRENKLGLVVDAIDAIPGAIAALTAEEYAQMAASARAWGEKLRRGGMTREALEQLG